MMLLVWDFWNTQHESQTFSVCFSILRLPLCASWKVIGWKRNLDLPGQLSLSKYKEL